MCVVTLLFSPCPSANPCNTTTIIIIIIIIIIIKIITIIITICHQYLAPGRPAAKFCILVPSYLLVLSVILLQIILVAPRILRQP
jgi:hypothetical protein